MDPRLICRFHIWHMLTREMPFCDQYAGERRYFRPRTRRYERLRGAGSRSRSAISSTLGAITRHSLHAPVLFKWGHRKTPVDERPGLQLMAIEITNNRTHERNEQKKEQNCRRDSYKRRHDPNKNIHATKIRITYQH